MKYRDGAQVKAGDRVKVEGFFEGTVAIDFDDRDAIEGFDIADWIGCHGVLISFENGSLLHVVDSDDDGIGPAMLEKCQPSSRK